MPSPEETGLGSVGDRGLQQALGAGILVAEVDEPARGSRRVGGDRHPLDHRVGIVVHQHPVLEAPRLSFVCVADDRLRAARRVANRAPLSPRGEPRTAPTRQTALVDQVEHGLRLERQRAFQSGIPAAGAVAIERVASGLADSRENALLGSRRRRGRKQRWGFAQVVRARSGENGVPSQHRHGVVAPSRTGHRLGEEAGRFETRDHVPSAAERADRAGAHAWPTPSTGLAGEVVVERDRAEEIGDRDAKLLRDEAQDLVREVPVTFMEVVEQR